MSTTALNQISEAAILSAAIVYGLGFLSHLAEWAFSRLAMPSVRHEQDAVTTGAPSRPAASPTDAQPERARRKEELWGRIGVSLTVLAFGLNLVGLITRGLAAQRVPWGNMYEFTVAACVGTVAVYLLMLPRHDIRWLGLPLTGLVVTMLMLAVLLLDVPAGPVVPALRSYWLYIHVTAAIIATGAFTVGATSSALFLVQDWTRSRNKAPAVLRRLPGADVIDELSYRVHAFGFPIWTFAALIAGPIWARYAWGRYWGWDPKEVWAFITWVAYAAYLHARATAGWRGRRAAVVALVGFATVIFNFVGINIFGSGLHSYSGL